MGYHYRVMAVRPSVLWLIMGVALGLLSICPLSATAFPDTPILSDFTGADNTTPPSANWTNAEIRNGFGGCDIEGNALAPSATTSFYGCYWNVGIFGPAAEAYATIVNIGSTAFMAVCVRIATAGTDDTTDGYCVEAADASSEVQIVRLDNAAETVLATVTQAITTTDKIGIRALGDQICAWFSDDGGAWAELGCVTDSTYATAGYIAVYLNGNTTIGGMDDVGGGTLSVGMMRRRLKFS